ncbi:MAG: GDP-mannose 4,6-dehydratase, partial [Myxococcales bacterium]|nr:GDP-mannose 4,6-dehydratase [Myxococcales bacterium]
GITRKNRELALSPRYSLPQGVQSIPCELTSSEDIHAVLKEARPDEVYHLASPSFSPACWETPVETAEMIGLTALRLAEAMRLHCPEAHLVNAASSEMYGMCDPPQNEQTPLQPLTPYGISKTHAYRYLQLLRDRWGMRLSNAILFPHESPRRQSHFFSQKVSEGVARIYRAGGGELILGSLDAHRDWTHAKDTVEAIACMGAARNASDYVVASGVTHTVRQWCELAFSHVGLNWSDHVVVDPALVRFESHVMCGDASRLRDALGWRPRVPFTDLVIEMVDAALDRTR